MDLRGQFIRGWSAGSGVDAGRALGSNQASQNLSHTHSVNDPGHAHPMNSAAFFNQGTIIAASQGGSNLGINNNSGSATTGISINSDGGAESRPINVALLVCMKQ